MEMVDIVWFKEGVDRRGPYISVWNFMGKFYQKFQQGEKEYNVLAPMLDLLPFATGSYNSQSYKLEEAELASILGDVTSCDERSESTS